MGHVMVLRNPKQSRGFNWKAPWANLRMAVETGNGFAK